MKRDGLILGALALFAFTRRPQNRGGAARSSAGKTSAAPSRPVPKLRAMLYRTPADANETTRIAVEKAPGQPMEKRAIMSSPKAAWDLVQKSGWTAAPQVQELEADPK